MSSIDPFSQVYDYLWQLVESYPPWDGAVRDGNRIRLDGTARNPFKETMKAADFSQVTLQPTDGANNFHANSSSAVIVQNFTIGINAESAKLHDVYFPLKFWTFQALASFRQTAGNLTWEGYPFLKKLEIPDSTDTLEEFDPAGNVIGWTALITISAEMWFPNNLFIYDIPSDLTAPVFTQQPQSLTVEEGNAASFNSTADGNPSPTYQWQKQGVTRWEDISGATSPSYVIFVTNLSMDGDKYRCVATNSEGSAISNHATLNVTAAPPPLEPPLFFSQPSSQTITVGNTATFTAAASGNPGPTYQWEEDTGGGFVPIVGETGTTFKIPAVDLSQDQNQYRCVATNSEGSAISQTATLTVITAGIGSMVIGSSFIVG